MSDSAKIAGIAGVVSFKGRMYQVAVRNLEMEAAFSVWAQMRAVEATERLDGRISPQAMAMRRAHHAETDAFVFDWGGEGCNAARFCTSGIKEMFFLQIAKMNKAPREVVDDMAQDPPTWDLMVKHTIGKLDPNPQGAEQGEQPPPSSPKSSTDSPPSPETSAA